MDAFCIFTITIAWFKILGESNTIGVFDKGDSTRELFITTHVFG